MNYKELIKLLKSENNLTEIADEANKIRKEYKGDGVHLRGLIEFTNHCFRNCLYCGIRKDNKYLSRFHLTKEEIINRAIFAKNLGYKTIVLQGGEDISYNLSEFLEIISNIKNLGFALTLSLGEKTKEEYKAFKNAGADRYLLRIETTDSNLYKKLHPNSSHKNRFKCLEYIKDAGFEVGTGIMTGLPEQTLESIAEDILFFKEIEADMIGIGPFIPSPDTPLANEAGGSFELAVKTMALTRIILKDINIPATTAMETIKKNGRFIALNSGANVIMPNVTGDNAKNYKIYPKNSSLWNNISTQEADEKLKTIGRFVSNNFGFRED